MKASSELYLPQSERNQFYGALQRGETNLVEKMLRGRCGQLLKDAVQHAQETENADMISSVWKAWLNMQGVR